MRSARRYARGWHRPTVVSSCPTKRWKHSGSATALHESAVGWAKRSGATRAHASCAMSVPRGHGALKASVPLPTLRNCSALLLAQLEALDLAGGGARQVRPDVDPARELPRAGAFLDVALDRLEETLIGRVTVLQHHERLRLDDPVGVLLADHRGLQERLVRDQGGLDL